ncbi:MAG: hypothetical protein GF307_03480 [candidate division Zixibacteria bacterium]|nr:hypothetical protein [candidate division Zixibacteria bacterium]
MKRIALHICCAPCAVHTTEHLSNEGYDVVGFWYNPNIHPYVEFVKRLFSLKKFSDRTGVPVIYDESYDLDDFLRNISDNTEEPFRCMKCYAMRLSRVAEMARDEGLGYFTSTLTVSPYQDHNIIKKIGKEVGEKHGIEYIYFDFRDGFREGQRKAREMGLYMQKYCGCIFSERDRFMDMTTEKIIKKFG